MLIDPPYDWTAQDEANYDFLKKKYEHRELLGEQWLHLRKTASQNEFKEDGKTRNPNYPRLAMEAELARLVFDNAYLISRMEMMQQQVDLVGALFQRVGILEGAYQSLALATSTVKGDYTNRLKGWLDAHGNPRPNPPPPRPRAVGEIVAEDYPIKPKEQENGLQVGTES